ncbi:MAG: nitroreductase, partial [Candidatus Thorarchaeota archaeon]
MPLLDHLLLHGTIFAVMLTVYLLSLMRFSSPRVWAFSDYPKEITDTVAPQTKEERRLGGILAIPFFILILGFPIISTMMLEATYVGTIPLTDAFLNIFGIAMFGTAADLFILDWLIVGTITPDFVIIPGTE